MTIFPIDANNNVIYALRPSATTEHVLTTEFQEALSSSDQTRVLRLFTENTGCVVQVGLGRMTLASGTPEAMKLDAGLVLEARGSGNLEITEMA